MTRLQKYAILFLLLMLIVDCVGYFYANSWIVYMLYVAANILVLVFGGYAFFMK